MCLGPGPLLVWGSPAVRHLPQCPPATVSRSQPQPLGCRLQPYSVSFSGVTRESQVTEGPGSGQPEWAASTGAPGEGEQRGVGPGPV